MKRRRAAVIVLVVLGIAACSPKLANVTGLSTTDTVKRLKNGEQVAVRPRWTHICCDCLLVHHVEMVFDQEDGVYLMRWWRDNERTNRLRELLLEEIGPDIEPPDHAPQERDIRIQ